jgi:hypothetical protein
VLLDSYWFDKPWFLTEGNLLLYASHLPLGVPNERVLYASSRFAWAPTKEVNFRDLEDNMFIVQANCLGDWERITKHGP